MAIKLQHKIRLLTSLSILVWVTTITALSNFMRRQLTRLILSVAPSQTAETGVLTRSYKSMQDQLSYYLEDIEQKKRKLEESEEQLRQSRDFLQTIIDSLDEELMVLDSQFCITQANRRLRLNHKDEVVIGRYCYEVTRGLSHPCRPPSYVCPVSKVWQTDTPVRVTHVHKANHEGEIKERYLDVSAYPFHEVSGKITQVVVLTRDVTEGKELEKRILENNRQLLALNVIASSVSQSLSLDTILNIALDKVLELEGDEIGGILLLDEKSQKLSYRVYRGFSDEYVQRIAGLLLGEGIAGQVAQQGKTFVVEDISKDSRVSRPVVVSEEGIKAFVAVPLKSKDKVVGVLTISSRRARTFTEQEVQLLNALGHQLGIAIENARLYEELQSREQMHADLLRQIISAQEDERRRVARELHDVTSQALATLAVRLEGLNVHPETNAKGTDTQLEGLKSLLGDTSREVHRLIHDLRPSLLDDLGILAALRSCAHSSLDSARIEVHFEVIGPERRLPSQVEITLFRIAQEAITNVASHSRAESAYISLEFKDKAAVLQIEDDGFGYDQAEVFSSAGGKESMGLLGMKERADLLGGTLIIDTQPGRGTKVVAEVPVDWEQDNV